MRRLGLEAEGRPASQRAGHHSSPAKRFGKRGGSSRLKQWWVGGREQDEAMPAAAERDGEMVIEFTECGVKSLLLTTVHNVFTPAAGAVAGRSAAGRAGAAHRHLAARLPAAGAAAAALEAVGRLQGREAAALAGPAALQVAAGRRLPAPAGQVLGRLQGAAGSSLCGKQAGRSAR